MKKFALLSSPALLIVVLVSLAVGNSEKTGPPKYTTKVRLDIAANEEIKNEVYSYLSRELRSLGDAKLVEDNPDWTIKVIALQIKTKAGYKSGITLSVVITKRLSEQAILKEGLEAARQEKLLLDELISEPDSRNSESLLSMASFWHNRLEYLANLNTIHAHWLMVGDTKDLQHLCQGIVADFDAEHLKTDRKMWQMVQEVVRSQGKSKEDSTTEKGSVFDDIKKPKDD